MCDPTGHPIPVRIRLGVGEIVRPLEVGAERGVFVVRRERERRAAAPAPHQFGGDELLRLVRVALRPEEFAESADVLLEPQIGHEAAVARQFLRLRDLRDGAAFVGIAEKELARLDRRSRARRGRGANSFDRNFRKAIEVPEMLARSAVRRDGLEIQKREQRDATDLRQVCLMCLRRSIALGAVAREQDRDRVERRVGESSVPMIGVIRAREADDRARVRRVLREILRERWRAIASSTPSARSPFHVNPTVTHRMSGEFEPTDAPVPTLSTMPASHARPASAFAKLKNS